METQSDREEGNESEKERKSCSDKSRSAFELHRWTSRIRLEILKDRVLKQVEVRVYIVAFKGAFAHFKLLSKCTV